jgi:ubiquinone/menaquinone biosynthesis C-methylase UbiE
MSLHTCPWWLGYFLVSPVRRWIENPAAYFAGTVRPGMRVLEPGPGMGYFTLELARLVGPAGRVVAVDLQPKMIAALRRRARRAGLADRIEARCCTPAALGVGDLAGTFDLAVVIHMLHEVEAKDAFLQAIRAALKPGGGVLVVEPRGHVSPESFQAELNYAAGAGLVIAEGPAGNRLRALLRRPEV